ncbi:Na+/H+ antiporter NhaC family protein [Haematobacter genomosp. 1]|nr:Na+/H+ antiporter NhaC family protein [Haematobacter genomosp. 1]
MKLFDPAFFYVTATALCAVVSFAIGSSWTVVGTLGVGLMGIAISLGLDPTIGAWAIISGAYFGDTPPLSDSANLAAATGGANLYDHVRETLPNSFGALAVELIVFWLLGGPGDADVAGEIVAISSVVRMSPLLFLPLAVVIGLALLRLPPFATIFAGAIAAGILAVLIAPDLRRRRCNPVWPSRCMVEVKFRCFNHDTYADPDDQDQHGAVRVAGQA